MYALILILSTVFLVSLISFIGVFFLTLKKNLEDLLLILVSFAVGGLLGGAFLHLLPEALSSSVNINVFLCLIFGFLLFFILECFLYWRHCHKGECEAHPFTYLNLIGDSIHNFIDGIIIATSFMINTPLGVSSSLAIIFHEIPQEIGDFGVLVYGGFSKKKALLFNFLSALTAFLGAFFGYFLHTYVYNFSTILLSIAAGGFIYIAGSDLVPELHKERNIKNSVIQVFCVLLGIFFMWLLKMMFS